MSITPGMLDRLKANKHMSFKELQALALNIGYEYTSKSGSHEKYTKKGYPLIIITVSKKRDSSLHQNDVMKTLRTCYAEIEPSVLMPAVILEKKPVVTLEKTVIEETEFTEVPEHCLDDDWRMMIRKIRVYYHKSLEQVANHLYIGTNSYFNIEKATRRFSKDELNLFCMMFNFNPMTFPEIPLQETKQEKMPTVLIKKINDNTEDIITAVELKLARYKELNDILSSYDELKKEYDILKKQLMLFSKELL